MKYKTQDREAGNFIDEFNTIEEAREAILQYEEEDKKDGTYTPNFYEVAEIAEEPTTAEKVRAIRKSLGLTQQAMSEAYGIPKRTIENWEGGKTEPPAYVLTMLEIIAAQDAEKREV